MYIKQMTFTPKDHIFIHKAQLENQTYLSLVFHSLYLSVYRPENPRKFLQFKLFFTYKWKFNIIMRLYSFQLSLFQIHGTFSVLYNIRLVQNFIYVGNRICSNTKAEKTILGAYSVKELDYMFEFSVYSGRISGCVFLQAIITGFRIWKTCAWWLVLKRIPF